MSQAIIGNSGATVITSAGHDVDRSFSGWKTYPASLPDFDDVLWDTERISRDLIDQSPFLFSGEVNLKVTDVDQDPSYVAKTVALHQNDAEKHIGGSRPGWRIISIMRKHSLAPLNITKDLLLKILRYQEVRPCFLDMLFALRKGDQLSEKGHTFWAPFRLSKSVYEICYQLKYMEKNDHKQGARWSERHIGVYHRFGEGERATVILLHANPSTALQKRIETLIPDEQSSSKRLPHPLMLHVLILSTYLDNWRWALQDYGQLCTQKEDQFLTAPLQHPLRSFRELQELRNTESKLLVASSILKATLSIITGLESCGRSLSKVNPHVEPGSSSDGDDLAQSGSPEIQDFKALRLKCKGYLDSVKVIQNRIHMLVDLLADSLNQQSQQTATKIADSTYSLTRKSVGDNAIVKVVTVITLIYLPVQGVATFFGMNLSDLQEDTNKIRFAQDWWLFLAASIPLTFITLGVLVIAMRLEKQNRKSDVGRGNG